jgi:mycoredoxin
VIAGSTGNTGSAESTGSAQSAESSGSAVTVYSAQWCGYCHRLAAQLDRVGIEYELVDIDERPDAQEFISAVNGGSWIIPTVQFADGSALVNPSVRDVQAHLAEIG